ncbi:F-box protein PP2-B15-like [Lycium barbarum]|uniref:F-box protein PP2-B15-like n=1 Tax=Lycium barbarum TaxID=112863 RepID=UPI00293F3B3D|nr:F-box protein PP2-B15-like [Lycium barbarum]
MDITGLIIEPQRFQLEFLVLNPKKRFAFLQPDGECQDEEGEDWTLPFDAEHEGPFNWHEDPSILQAPKLRDDGWFELELGEFLCEKEDDCIEMRMQEVQGHFPKRGLIVEGIELRLIIC